MGFTGNMKYKTEDDFIAHASKLEAKQYKKDALENDGFFNPKANLITSFGSRRVQLATIETNVQVSGWGQNQNGQR